MRKIQLFLFSLIVIFLGSSCEVIDSRGTTPVGIVEGVRPIYASNEGWDNIQATAPRAIGELGKIYYKDPFIYVNERNKGIHVLDNTNPANPIPVKFIEVLGSEDIAIKGDMLYIDNVTDLVTIDISNIDQIKVTSRVKDLYQESKRDYPDGYSGYFECVDNSKGIVLGWEKATLENPACLR